MKKERDYEIGIAKLSNKTHLYEFELDDSFFDLFGRDLILGGNLIAHVELDKTESMLTFHIDIKGQVRLTCDRSLDEFDYPIDVQGTFRIKYGDENAELDDDLWQITSNTQSINIAQHLYDYIGLAVPMKKLHPRFVEETDEEDDKQGDILIYSSRNTTESDEDDDDDEDVDPRWDALRNLN
ncbi:YceD family protein [Pontibacter toksunensis]|uniref:YceD family protein n=1 Tax=Pontibacter toksunensis TaxID=1332631 RepID=A0ABW6C292_9BACT